MKERKGERKDLDPSIHFGNKRNSSIRNDRSCAWNKDPPIGSKASIFYHLGKRTLRRCQCSEDKKGNLTKNKGSAEGQERQNTAVPESIEVQYT